VNDNMFRSFYCKSSKSSGNEYQFDALFILGLFRHTLYKGCFTTLGHNCRRWFPRPLWWKKFI